MKKLSLCFFLSICFILSMLLPTMAAASVERFYIREGGVAVFTSDTTKYPDKSLTSSQKDSDGRVQVYVVNHKSEHRYEFACTGATHQLLRVSAATISDGNVWDWIANSPFGSPAYIIQNIGNSQGLTPKDARYGETATNCQLRTPYMTQYLIGVNGVEVCRNRVYWYAVDDITARDGATDTFKQNDEGKLNIGGWALNYSGLKSTVAYINTSTTFSKTGFKKTLARTQRNDVKPSFPSPALVDDPFYKCGYASAIPASETGRVGQFYVSNLVTFNDDSTLELPVKPIVICYAPPVTASISGTNAYKKGDTASALTVNRSYTAPEKNGTTKFTYSYQWYKNGTAISGATGQTYTPDSTTMNTPGVYTYSCEVKLTVKAEGQTLYSGNIIDDSITKTSTTTPTYTVIVADKPSITTNLSGSENVAVNTNKTISIKATGPDGGKLSYQWYENGTAISGATSASYTANSSSVVTNSYYCVVTNTVTSGGVTATNTVTSGTKKLVFYRPASTPSFSVAAVSVVYPENDTLSIQSLSATYTDAYAYQWYSVDTNTTSDGTAILDATTDAYTPATSMDVGTYYYYVTVTNTYTSNGVTTAASHSVCASYTVTRQPIERPSAVEGLVYNGLEQTGVLGGTGYVLVNYVATNTGIYEATATLLPNYQWSTPDDSDATTADHTVLWTIAPKELSLLLTAQNKVYDGTTDAEGTLSWNGVVPNDDVSVSFSSIAFDEALPGTRTVTATEFIMSGADINNYALAADSVSDTATIEILTGLVAYDISFEINTEEKADMDASVLTVFRANVAVMPEGASVIYTDGSFGSADNGYVRREAYRDALGVIEDQLSFIVLVSAEPVATGILHLTTGQSAVYGTNEVYSEGSYRDVDVLKYQTAWQNDMGAHTATIATGSETKITFKAYLKAGEKVNVGTNIGIYCGRVGVTVRKDGSLLAKDYIDAFFPVSYAENYIVSNMKTTNYIGSYNPARGDYLDNVPEFEAEQTGVYDFTMTVTGSSYLLDATYGLGAQYQGNMPASAPTTTIRTVSIQNM